jgi:hypothetical protein
MSNMMMLTVMKLTNPAFPIATPSC